MKINLVLTSLVLLVCACAGGPQTLDSFPEVSQRFHCGYFPLVRSNMSADICIDPEDAEVVRITAGMLSEDIGMVSGCRPSVITGVTIPEGPVIVAGTVGNSRLIDSLAAKGAIKADGLAGKWESFLIQTVIVENRKAPMLVIAGSDRRGTAYGLTSLSEAIGVSPWYWWADVVPEHKESLFVQPGRYLRKEPAVRYRGIFINDERFGGWARWVENNFDKESGQVGPKVYRKVFELLLRLRANYLWPAMHNGSKAFNSNPENASLADDYAIVMGSSHCEQMLRNNEDEWKNAGTWGDFNYLTNRENMIRYWEERVQSNGRYENIYTLGLRGIHDYPMEGASTTQERMELMQLAINDQRDILARNIDNPLEEIPQLLCTYEEVLDAYHAGLQIPEDVTLLWSDDKHGYTRNLCNPQEQEHKGGAGIYYHLSYHGDPASWIWLSPLSPSFISTELTKAYTYGARKIWIFNVGDIKPAEKEISFVMDLAWDLDKWNPENAHKYIEAWSGRTFGKTFAKKIASIQDQYYRLQASGKDSHVYFLEYTEEDILKRLSEWEAVAAEAEQLRSRIPENLKAAYFELIEYPVRGAWMINEYQLLSRLSMAHATYGNAEKALSEAQRATEMFNALNEWTDTYNKNLLNGKWDDYFNWQPYHWFRSSEMDAPICTEELLEQVSRNPAPRYIGTSEALGGEGAVIESETEGDLPLWIHAMTPTHNFSKAEEDNVFCSVNINGDSFLAAAKPVNNIWHAPFIGPMWSRVGTIHLKHGENLFHISWLKEGAFIDSIFAGVNPPFPASPMTRIPASECKIKKNTAEGKVRIVRGLGFNDGVTVLPFDTPSYTTGSAPAVSFDIIVPENAKTLEIRTLADLHVYEGRDARYAVGIGNKDPEIFSIHTEDFSAEWRWNVLRGYSKRTIDISDVRPGKNRVSFYFLDPGIVLQELIVN